MLSCNAEEGEVKTTLRTTIMKTTLRTTIVKITLMTTIMKTTLGISSSKQSYD